MSIQNGNGTRRQAIQPCSFSYLQWASRRLPVRILAVLPAFFACGLLMRCSKKDGDVVAASGYAPVRRPNDLGVGQAARRLLSASNAAYLDIELQYMPGMQLNNQSVGNLLQFLRTYLNKPGGITLTQQPVPSMGKTLVSLEEIAYFEQQHRTAYDTLDRIRVYMLVADADYSNSGVIGISYRNTSLCLFGKTLQANSGRVGQVGRVPAETSVMEHEWGHLLGLVNRGTPMQTGHEDAAHPPHCSNSSCLMYYEIEVGRGSMIYNSLPVLDSNCINDLHANGGR